MSEKQYRDYTYRKKDDYDKKIRINDEDLAVYSRKKLNALYQNKKYEVIGETFEGKKRNKKKDTGRIELNEARLNISKVGYHNCFFRKTDAYIEVSGGFIAILKLRLFPFILLGVILLGMIGGIVYGLVSDGNREGDSIASNSGTVTADDVEMSGMTVIKPDYDLEDEDENQTPVATEKTNIVRLSIPNGKLYFNFELGDKLTDRANITLFYTFENSEYQIFSNIVDIVDGAISDAEIDFTTLHHELKSGTYDGRIVLKLSDNTELELKIEMYIINAQSGTIGMGYSTTATVDLDSGDIDMLYALNTDATHNAIVQLIIIKDDEEYCIAQSGIVTVGHKLEKMALKDIYKAMLQKGHYKGKYRLNLYNDDNPAVDMQPEVEIDIVVK